MKKVIIISKKDPASLNIKEELDKINEDKIVFALANPVSELSLEEAKKLDIRIFATGRSDYPNQVNNAICFPGFLRALLDFRVRKITDKTSDFFQIGYFPGGMASVNRFINEMSKMSG